MPPSFVSTKVLWEVVLVAILVQFIFTAVGVKVIYVLGWRTCPTKTYITLDFSDFTPLVKKSGERVVAAILSGHCNNYMCKIMMATTPPKNKPKNNPMTAHKL